MPVRTVLVATALGGHVAGVVWALWVATGFGIVGQLLAAVALAAVCAGWIAALREWRVTELLAAPADEFEPSAPPLRRVSA